MKLLNVAKWCFCLSILMCSCFQETEVNIEADFIVEVIDDNYSVPVRVKIHNNTKGADLFSWTFEGANPRESRQFDPEEIIYNVPGIYKICLEAWNSTERQIKEISLQIDSVLKVGFEPCVNINDFSPVEVVFSNKSRGGNTYYWEFEGGTPSFSNLYDPPVITFEKPGVHIVRLSVSNGRKTVEVFDSVKVRPSLSVDFNMEPLAGNEDYEVPFRAKLINKTVSGLTYQWIADGGVLDCDTVAEPVIVYQRSGAYEITLTANNGKQVQRCTKMVKIGENSNLYTMKDIRLGITAAKEEYGCFYACDLKRVIKVNELDLQTGKEIDLVFWGLGEQFQNCRFVSPDQAPGYAFPNIPGARSTRIINWPSDQTGYGLTIPEFDNMKDDTLLSILPFDESSGKDDYWSGVDKSPRLILFRTADGRKGAVKVKNYTQAGVLSFITVDIKIQKEDR